MLVDFTPGVPDVRTRFIIRAIGQYVELERLDRGLYAGSINFGNLYESVIADSYPFDPWPPQDATTEELRGWWAEQRRHLEEDGWPAASYGVSDSLEQVVERYPCIDADPRPLIVIGSVITREHHGDWRWHKWGPYIGDHTPRYEHIGDETDIDQVWVWHVYEVTAESAERVDHAVTWIDEENGDRVHVTDPAGEIHVVDRSEMFGYNLATRRILERWESE